MWKVRREPVQTLFRHGALGLEALTLALLGGLAIAGSDAASAQVGSTPPRIEDGLVARGDTRNVPLRLTQEQKQTIADAVRRDNKAVEPAVSFVPTIGAPVPPAIELYMLPDVVLAQVPAAKTVKYTVVKNQLLLIDPTNMRVVEIIPQ
jgi:Protein of unknown function (DUF1236)